MNKKTLDGIWTQFWDMHSGGGNKVGSFEEIYVQASEDEAEDIFEEVTGENPNWVACDCCGANFVVSEYESLQQATAFIRGCTYFHGEYIEEGNGWKDHLTLEEYIERDDVLLIFSDGSTNKLWDGDK